MDAYGAMQYDPTGEQSRNMKNLQDADTTFRTMTANTRGLRDMAAMGESTPVNADASGDKLPQGAPVNVNAAPPVPAPSGAAPAGTITAPPSAPGVYGNPALVPNQTEAETLRLARMRAPGTVDPRSVSKTPSPESLRWNNSPAAQSDRASQLRKLNPASEGVDTPTLVSGTSDDAAIAKLKAQDAAIRSGSATSGSSVASRNNNPGNLVYVGQAGATPSATVNADGTRFAVFQTPEAGAAAAQAQLQKEIAGGNNTVAGIIHKWAGAQYKGNSTASEQNYVASVAKALGVNPNAPLTADKIPLMSQAMFKVEGGSAPTQTAQAPAPQQAAQAQPAVPAGPQGSGQQYQPGGNQFDYTSAGAEQALQTLARQQQMAEMRVRNAVTPQEAMQARSEADQAAGLANVLHGQIMSAHAYKAVQDTAAGNMESFGSLVQLASQMRGTPLAIHKVAEGQYQLFDAQGKPYGVAGAPADIAHFIYGQTPGGQQLLAGNASKFNEAYQTSAGKAAGESGKELALENLKGQNEVQKALATGNMSILLEKVKQGEFMFSAPNAAGDIVVMSKNGQNLGVLPASLTGGGKLQTMGTPIAPWMLAQK